MKKILSKFEWKILPILLLLFIMINLISEIASYYLNEVGKENDDYSIKSLYIDYLTFQGANFYSRNPLLRKEYFYNPNLTGWRSNPSLFSKNSSKLFLKNSGTNALGHKNITFPRAELIYFKSKCITGMFINN